MSSHTQYMIAFLVTCSDTDANIYVLYRPASRHNKTWPSSTKLRELHRPADRNEDWWTQWKCHKTVKPGVNLWLHGLIHKTTRLERDN